MKKIIVLLIALASFLTVDLNAQSCCTVKKKCIPKQCCPTQQSSCTDVKDKDSIDLDEATTNATVQNNTTHKPTRQRARIKKESALASTNKTE